jgi:FMN reductase
MTILLLAGSPSLASRSTRLLQHAGEKLALLGHRYTTLHVRNLPAEALLHANFGDPDIQIAKAQVAQSEAIVVATPVYKASFSGVLKAFLDLLPQNGFEDKLVLPLATGGSQSHMLALDYALRPVLSALGARHVLPSIYATDVQVGPTTDQVFALDSAIEERIANGVENLSASLFALREPTEQKFEPVPFSKVRCSV